MCVVVTDIKLSALYSCSPPDTEEAIFAALGLPYVPPEKREG